MKLERIDHLPPLERVAGIRNAKRGPGRIRAVIASEDPLSRWDDYDGNFIREVLWLPGARWRAAKRQLPLIDGDTSTVRNVVGSVRGIERVSGELIGNLLFCRDRRSQEVLRKVQSGDVEDFSVEHQPLEMLTLSNGERFHSIKGPMQVIVAWRPLFVRIS